jgi:hydrogenase-4 component F
MWKYLMICSIGVAFAFLGTLMVAASASGLHLSMSETLLWTKLRNNAVSLDPMLLKAGFLCLLVGYGTKAGLAPMHSWLPDAHSQAPAPVSAIFSGFMLNAALYCVIRYIPIVESTAGLAGWGLQLLVLFGIVSILVSAAFIIFQHDVKRLLAYHSVEHIGIITLGLGLGGIGTFAALFHTLNHSICKTLAFFAAGRLGQTYGTYDMNKMSGSLRSAPVWGAGLFGSLLALIGVAPFAIFMSEFQILKAAMDSHATLSLILFLGGSSVVFVGALKHAIAVAWGKPSPVAEPERAGAIDMLLVVAPLLFLLVLGLWMPGPLLHILKQASLVLEAH